MIQRPFKNTNSIYPKLCGKMLRSDDMFKKRGNRIITNDSPQFSFAGPNALATVNVYKCGDWCEEQYVVRVLF